MELVAGAVAAVIVVLGGGWLLLCLFLRGIAAEINAVRDGAAAKLDARERRLDGEMQRLEGRPEGRLRRLEDGQNNLRLELARLEGILIDRGRLESQWRAGWLPQPVITAGRRANGQAAGQAIRAVSVMFSRRRARPAVQKPLLRDSVVKLEQPDFTPSA